MAENQQSTETPVQTDTEVTSTEKTEQNAAEEQVSETPAVDQAAA